MQELNIEIILLLVSYLSKNLRAACLKYSKVQKIFYWTKNNKKQGNQKYKFFMDLIPLVTNSFWDFSEIPNSSIFWNKILEFLQEYIRNKCLNSMEFLSKVLNYIQKTIPKQHLTYFKIFLNYSFKVKKFKRIEYTPKWFFCMKKNEQK